MPLSHRQELVLAALSSRRWTEFAPVQVQKLFFLIDENIAGEIGGRQFAFEPYDYGPFDKAVYQELDRLAEIGLVQIVRDGLSASQRRYSLTAQGLEMGVNSFGRLGPRAQDFIDRVTDWVCGLSFAQLVGSIYRAYPHMRANSIFRG